MEAHYVATLVLEGATVVDLPTDVPLEDAVGGAKFLGTERSVIDGHVTFTGRDLICDAPTVGFARVIHGVMFSKDTTGQRTHVEFFPWSYLPDGSDYTFAFPTEVEAEPSAMTVDFRRYFEVGDVVPMNDSLHQLLVRDESFVCLDDDQPGALARVTFVSKESVGLEAVDEALFLRQRAAQWRDEAPE